MIYTLTFDKHRRIKEKYFDLNGKHILHARYSYDKEGRTSVDYERDIDWGFRQVFGGYDFNMPGSLTQLKYHITHADNCSEGEYQLKDYKEEYYKGFVVRNCFSPEGWLTHYTHTRYYNGGESSRQNRLDIRYDSDGLSGESIRYKTTPDEKEQPCEKVLFVQDEKGQRIFEETQLYDPASEEWIPKERHTCQYDEHGNVCYSEKYTFDKEEGTWKGIHHCEWECDAQGRRLSEKVKIWDGESWENYEKSYYLYDERHQKKTSTEIYSWNKEKKEWVGRTKNKYSFTVDEIPTEYISYDWDREQKDWTIKGRTTYHKEKTDSTSYNQDDSYRWENETWVPVLRRTSSENKQNHIHENKMYDWNNNTQQWEISHLSRYYHAPEKTVVREEYTKEDQTGLLTGWTRTETNYTIREDNNQIMREAYSLWNYEKHQWEYAVCRTHYRYSSKEEEWLFEKFDTQQEMWQNDRLVRKWQPDEETLCKEEQRWNTQTEGWVPYYQIISSPQRIAESVTSYRYDERLQTWIPWFRNQRHEQEKRILYSQWNQTKGEWENYAIWRDTLPEDSDHSQALFWDSSSHTWIEEKEWNDWSLPYHLREYFDIYVEVDYDTMVRKNYQSRK